MAKTTRKKKTVEVDVTPEQESNIVPGVASEILMNYAEGHYQKVFTGDGEMAFLDKHTNRTLLMPDDVKFYMEILHGYDILDA